MFGRSFIGKILLLTFALVAVVSAGACAAFFLADHLNIHSASTHREMGEAARIILAGKEVLLRFLCVGRRDAMFGTFGLTRGDGLLHLLLEFGAASRGSSCPGL